mgnify:CR=1 FL=1
MKIVRIDGLVFLRHWNKWYVMQEGSKIDQPAPMKFEGLRPFWEGDIADLVPDFTNTKLTEGKKRASTKSGS